MSYTGTEIFDRSISIIDELSETGTVLEAQVREYRFRAPALLDLWQKEMATAGGMTRVFEVSCVRKQNFLPEAESFQAVEYIDTEQLYESAPARCFFFSVDGPATVNIEQLIGATWSGVPGTFVSNGQTPTAFTGLINATSATRAFSHYKGILTPAINATRMRLRFSGATSYRHTNRALASYRYAAAASVPDFMPWYKITMPADFSSRTEIVDEFPPWQHMEFNNHRWEGNRDLYINFMFEGIIRIHYIPVPVHITALTQVLEVDDIAAVSGAYYLAEHFALSDQNVPLAEACRAKFAQLKAENLFRRKGSRSPSDIKDVLGVADIR